MVFAMVSDPDTAICFAILEFYSSWGQLIGGERWLINAIRETPSVKERK